MFKLRCLQACRSSFNLRFSGFDSRRLHQPSLEAQIEDCHGVDPVEAWLPSIALDHNALSYDSARQFAFVSSRGSPP